MKWYVASRTANGEIVSSFSERLRDLGEEIVLDWTIYDPAELRPYDMHEEKNRELSGAMTDGIKECDRVVIYSDPSGRGMYVELGIALGSDVPKIYAVGEWNNNSIFYMHEKVTRVDSLDDVIALEFE